MRNDLVNVCLVASFVMSGVLATSCDDAKADVQPELIVEPTREVVKELLLQDTLSWNGDAIPAYPQGTPQCTILKITVPPHTKLSPHTHSLLNAGVMVSGQLHVVDIEGREITIKAGEVILECVNHIHYGENNGEEDAVLYVFYAGVYGQELSEAATME